MKFLVMEHESEQITAELYHYENIVKLANTLFDRREIVLVQVNDGEWVGVNQINGQITTIKKVRKVVKF